MQKKLFVRRWRLDQLACRQRLQRVVHWLVVFALTMPALLPLHPVAAQSNASSTIDQVTDDYERLTATLHAGYDQRRWRRDRGLWPDTLATGPGWRGHGHNSRRPTYRHHSGRIAADCTTNEVAQGYKPSD